MQTMALGPGYAGRGAEFPAQGEKAALVAQGAFYRIEHAVLLHQPGGQGALAVSGLAQQVAAGRGNHHLVLQLVAAYQIGDRLEYRAGLALGAALYFQLIVLELREGLEQLLKGWNGAGLGPVLQTQAGIHAAQLFGGMGGDAAANTGSTLQGRVVDHHQLVIGGQVQVQLNAGDSGLQGTGKTGQGVFRCFAAGTPVAVYEHVAPCGSVGAWSVMTHRVDHVVIFEVDAVAGVIPAGDGRLAHCRMAGSRLAVGALYQGPAGAPLRQALLYRPGLLPEGNGQGVSLGRCGREQGSTEGNG